MQWIWNNKEWIFSGVGVMIIAWVIRKISAKKGLSQSQKSGSNSTNIQSGRDTKINR